MIQERIRVEIEKKFTIKQLPELEKYTCIHMEQGYLCTAPIVRIRKANEDYILTYKSKTSLNEKEHSTKISNEVELPLTESSFYHLKEKIDGRVIEKDRYLSLDYRYRNSYLSQIERWEEA